MDTSILMSQLPCDSLLLENIRTGKRQTRLRLLVPVPGLPPNTSRIEKTFVVKPDTSYGRYVSPDGDTYLVGTDRVNGLDRILAEI